MEAFKKYKLCLKELDYPNVNALDEEQIPSIFSLNNQRFLLSWIMTKLNPGTLTIDEPSKLSETAIEDYFRQQGLCKSSQKLFSSESVDVQIIFFDRIFEYLRQLKNSREVDDADEILQYEDVVNLLSKNVNLFPSFGPVTKYTPEKRKNTLSTCKQQIDILKGKINMDLVNVTDKIDFNDLLFNESDIKRKENLKKFVNNLTTAVCMIKETDRESEDDTFNIGNDVKQDLETCCMEMKTILQYFKSINLGHEISKQATAIISTKPDDDFTPVLRQYAEEFSTTVKLLQD
ncbi:hypothetical protein PPYR_04836 [Photinus pyralis]|uniref:Uncharacterized protein n=1 Tax=Photinus pyralis TaxID=7054 RepID=A0A1Y1MGD0_PHOPY|nr:uncharacterized protein LOC116165049 [Photinus pyralis]XP_031335179.1 uncharacterized protein LOC116165049 [Photinus pyralis]XP_031335180.1 uncharacterized protein LOC116165049 [Photinus pyralis]KAB0802650.1 hypothetical protein PPYR_04836 [Photinus pyralis]